MWDTVVEISTRLTHDRPCPGCEHAEHWFLPCDRCACATGRAQRQRGGSLPHAVASDG